MDDNQRREEKRKLKELRRELEEKIKTIIPDALKTKTSFEEVSEKIEEAVELDKKSAKQVIEAMLFAAGRPLTPREIGKMLKAVTNAEIVRYIEEIKAEYEQEDRGFRLKEIAGGYEISTLPQFSIWISRLEKEKKAKQASLAALETLAILAYKQPITRVEIEEIRGVDVTAVITTLLDRGFIRVVGRREVPGRPLLYGTTELFLEHFGLKALDDLPDIEEIKTLVDDTIRKEELLRKENIIPVTEEQLPEAESAPTQEQEEAASLADKYDEIARQIEGVKVKSARQISEILKPPGASEETQEKTEDQKKEQPEEDSTESKS